MDLLITGGAVPGAESAAVVLALNQGSSSLKFGLFRAAAGQLERVLSGSGESLADIAARLEAGRLPAPSIVGHRIVHGGPLLREPRVLDDDVLQQISAAAVLAPLHTGEAVALIDAARRLYPGARQVACFDTAFHADLPDVARVLPLPRALRQEGLRRYGFHGLSCESILHQLGPVVPERVVIAHLGHGCSVTAVQKGRSIDTSMGLTPSGGVVMGTRSGDLDPGVLIHLMRARRLDAAALEALVDRQSGLLGISGLDSDLRRLHAAAPQDADARLAIAMFCASVSREIAGMITALEGLDTLVFTGGIGENDAQVRAAICRGLGWFGITLDDARNRSRTDPIHAAASRCAVRVLPSQEDVQIARHAWALADSGRP